MELKYYEQYCDDIENVENFEKAKADNFKGWECHHKREAEFSRKELITLGMYYDVSSEELIFLSESEHKSLHMKGNKYRKGKHHSEETKKKLSDSLKGENNPNYGKHFSEEHKNKLSDAWDYDKHFTEETKKKLSDATKIQMKGMRWYNNGKINIRAKECPEGFTPGLLRKTIS